MFNGQNFNVGGMLPQQQQQQQQQLDGSHTQGFSGGVAANPQIQALLQQQQLQQLRWQQMQQSPTQPPVQQQQQQALPPTPSQQQQFFNPAAFLNQNNMGGNAMQMNPANLNPQQLAQQMAGQAGAFAGLNQQGQVQQQQQQQQQMQQRQQSQQPQQQQAMNPFPSVNAQQLQAMMQGSMTDAMGGSFNPAAMLGQPGGGSGPGLGSVNGANNLPNFNGMTSGVDPALLMQRMGAPGSSSMPTMPINTAGMPYMMNGGMSNGMSQPHVHHQQPSQPARPPTASSHGERTPEPSKAPRTAKSSAKKPRGSMKSDAASTPTMGAAAIPSQSPGGMNVNRSRQSSLNSGRSQDYPMGYPGPGPGPPGIPPHLQQATMGQQMQPPQAQAGPSGWTSSLSIHQQQEIMAKVWEHAKGNHLSPADVLARMNLLLVKASQLPAGGAGASMPNGAAVITFDEARTLGIPVPTAASGPPAAPAMGQPPHAMSPQPMSGAVSGPHMQPNMGMPFGAPAQGPGPHVPRQSPAPQHLQHAQQQQQQQRARQASTNSRPDSRSGFPTGSMGPPPPMGSAVRRPSSAVDLDAARGGGPGGQSSVDVQMGAPSPSVVAGEDLRRASAQPPSAHGPFAAHNSSSDSPSVHPGSLPSGYPGPGLAAPPPPPNPNLPPVHGGALPPTTAQGHRVTKLNTRITPLPNFSRPSLTQEDLNGASWQPMNEKDEQHLLAIMSKDAEYEEQIKQHTVKMQSAIRSRVDNLHPLRRQHRDGSVIQGLDLHWWERAEDEAPVQVGHEGQFRIIFPDDRREELKAKWSGRAALTSTYLERLKPRQLTAVSNKKEDLVPIRLDIDHEGWKLRDTFTWNSTDDITSHDEFARNLCEDYGLPETNFVPLIRESLAVQIAEHIQTRALRPQSFHARGADEGEESSRGTLSKGELKWWAAWRDTVKDLEEAAWGRKSMSNLAALKTLDQHDEAEAKAEMDLPLPPVTDLRIPIKLDITVGAMNLIDQIEWDVLDDTASPEAFARAFAVDLGLAGEFVTAISHSIREQVDVHLRSLALAGYAFDGSYVVDDELKGAFLPEIANSASVSRAGQDVEDHTPRLLQLSEAEVDRLERERERENKRKRRQTRGRRGVNMPDRDPVKTQRTPVICGLQSHQIELAGGAAAVAAAAAAAAGASGGLGADFVPGVRSSTRRAAAAANAHLHSIASDYDTPTPAAEPRASEAPVSSAKRQRLESHAVHFKYPGGLGRSTSEGPLFAPGANTFVAEKGAALPLHRAVAAVDASANATRPAPSPLRDVKASTSNSAASTPKNVRPEDVANQHPNMHDGHWHCSNCGIPGWLAAGRRKGPLGEKTLCGPCGKFWHRFRRMKQAQYTRDEVFHRSQMTSANGAAMVAVGSLTVDDDASSSLHTPRTATPARDDFTGDEKELSVGGGSFGRERKQPSTRGGSPDLPFQPVGSPSDSEASDRSQSPRASRRGDSPAKQRTIVLKKSQSPMKVDGGGGGGGASTAGLPPPLQQSHSASVFANIAGDTAARDVAAGASPPVAAASASPPEWLTQAAEQLRQKYPHDHFELRAKGVGLWRIKCTDCPGKLYTPGPEESLTNFEVHLRNRIHRANVVARMQKSGKSGEAVAAAARNPGSPGV
ncbi:unnamed protein product [Parajaminaea phylloscopi]